jgi:hypothetical protein
VLPLTGYAAIPTVGVWTTLALTVPSAATVGSLVAIATLVGGGLVVGTLRAQLTHARTTIALAKDEREILSAKAERLEKRNAVLEQRPNLEHHAMLLGELTTLVTEQTSMLQQIRTAVVPPR